MKKITIKEVAQEAGVSKTTISRFLNNNFKNMSKETKEHISQVIERLNYRPSRQAQALKSKHSYLIGVVVADISNMYSPLLLKGIGKVLENKGYQMIIMDAANSADQEKKLLERLIDQNVEGIILQPSCEQTENYSLLVEQHIPVLLVDRQTTPKYFSSVTTNNVEAITEVLDEAVLKNYEQVVVLSEPIGEISTRRTRYKTVNHLVEKAGKTCRLIEVTESMPLEPLMKETLANKHKTLLFASNGKVLMQVLTWLIHEKVEIPKSLGVTGFDDWNISELVGPGITGIEQPSEKIGRKAAETLISGLAEGLEGQEDLVVPSAVRWRKSI